MLWFNPRHIQGSEQEKYVNREVRQLKMPSWIKGTKWSRNWLLGISAQLGRALKPRVTTAASNPWTIQVEGSSRTAHPLDLNSFYVRFEEIISKLNWDRSPVFISITQDVIKALRRTRERSSPRPEHQQTCPQALHTAAKGSVPNGSSMDSSTVPQLWKHPNTQRSDRPAPVAQQ